MEAKKFAPFSAPKPNKSTRNFFRSEKPFVALQNTQNFLLRSVNTKLWFPHHPTITNCILETDYNSIASSGFVQVHKIVHFSSTFEDRISISAFTKAAVKESWRPLKPFHRRWCTPNTHLASFCKGSKIRAAYPARHPQTFLS